MLADAALYSASNALVGLLIAASLALLARSLTTNQFGSFTLCISFIMWTSLFFEFGLFNPAARLAAQSESGERRYVVGASLAAYAPIGAAYCLFVFVASFAVDSIFSVDASSVLLVTAPFAFVYPFRWISLQLAQGVDRVYAYSVTLALGQGLFVAALVVVQTTSVDMSPSLAFVLRSAGWLVGALVMVAWLRPLFGRVRRYLPTLVEQAHAYGFKIYTGRVLSIATYDMDVLMLAALTDAKTVGFYTLAAGLTNVIGLPIIGVATALFSRMVKERRLERRWVALAWVFGLSNALVIWVFAEPFIGLVFSSKYTAAANLVGPLALAQTLRAITYIYNSYLQAQARGRELRAAGLILTGSNLLLNFLLIPPFGAEGAAWASFLALAVNFIAFVVFYRRTVRAVAVVPAG